ncbi:MAG: 3-oxoacyl-[acyl-carrier-protein] reductase [Bacteroidales bacterium]|nr:3-oxoacyl-[acyl-carrier-protein] reductase [Bacteroidales bacterium]
MLLENKTALITGAAKGIGKAIALKLASEGADIAFTYLTSEAAAMETRRELEACGVKVLAIRSDATDFESAGKVVEQVLSEFSRIDILVNNAGITRDGLTMRMDEVQWDAVIAANLKSAFNYTHAVLPSMLRNRCGSIVNISSVVGIHGNAGQSNYAASKAGLIGLAKSVAMEVGSRGVRVNVVAPGFIRTDMTAAMPDETLQAWEARIPLRRGGTPQDVAQACLFLASDMASYVTGQVIAVDGGIAM